jgi:hypothetical protein
MRCSQVFALVLRVLEKLFSIRSVLLFFTDVRRRCCTTKRCRAAFDVFGREHYPSQPIPCDIVKKYTKLSLIDETGAISVLDFPGLSLSLFVMAMGEGGSS